MIGCLVVLFWIDLLCITEYSIEPLVQELVQLEEIQIFISSLQGKT